MCKKLEHHNFSCERSPNKNSCFFGVRLSSISEPCAIILDDKSTFEFILQSDIMIEFSMLQFFKIQLSPMLVYFPIRTAGPILQFLPII